MEALDSSQTLDFTYTRSGYSCIKQLYPLHISSAYIVVFSGLACILTRLIPSITWTHYWFGRLYLISMFYAMASSLMIHNTGLPTGVIVSFAILLIGLSIGWPLINIHQYFLNKEAMRKVESEFNSAEMAVALKLEAKINEAKSKIIEQRSIYQRIFSFKTLHGSLMIVSWLNLAGRAFSTPPTKDFECYTMPVFKNVTSRHYTPTNSSSLELVPIMDPKYLRLPWANSETSFGLKFSLLPFLGCFLIAALYSLYFKRTKLTSRANESRSTVVIIN